MARLDYFAPGVYVEEVNRGSRPIEGLPTAIAGFVGFTEDVRNGAQLYRPMMVSNWNQYLEYFGRPNSDGFTDFGAYLPFSVYGWFLNGGGRCWVTSIGTRLPGTPTPDITDSGTDLMNRRDRPTLRFSLVGQASSRLNAAANGTNGGSRTLKVQILNGEPKAPAPVATVAEGEGEDEAPASTTTININTGEFFTVLVRQGDETLERFENLTMNPQINAEVADYVVEALSQSNYVLATDLANAGSILARRPANGIYEISPPLPVATQEELPVHLEGVGNDRTGIRGLFEIDEVTIVACPDLMRVYEAGLMDIDQVHSVMDLMIGMCEAAAAGDIPNPPNRMVVFDPPSDRVKPQDVSTWLSEEFNRRSQFAALYYPWIEVPNPRNAGRPIAVPPCGHVMGVWARTDETRGVHKAPANEVPRGVTGLAYNCNFREQEQLNPIGINCLRPFPNRGIRIWGARTLVEPDITDWRYINVRRLMSYIEKSIEIGTQWVVFEPNDEDLWQRVKRVVSNFLTELWRQGALMGSSPEQAFYVKCDGELNTPDTMILGRLYIEIGVCPVRPAEFVIFRISQWSGQDEG
ncbi:MAG: phage tail sheath C-terminal domain-containing protein [Cyanobacteria bacterium P01_F01_bin.86]